MAEGVHFTKVCSKCLKLFCDCTKRLGLGLGITVLTVTLSHIPPSFHRPPEWGAGHPHTEPQQDTRQPREFPKTSVATASTATYRGIFSPKQTFYAETVDRAGEVTVLRIDANGVHIWEPQQG
jgi:hypothetical protein